MVLLAKIGGEYRGSAQHATRAKEMERSSLFPSAFAQRQAQCNSTRHGYQQPLLLSVVVLRMSISIRLAS